MKINRLSRLRLLMVVVTVIAFLQLCGRVKAAPPLPFQTIQEYSPNGPGFAIKSNPAFIASGI